MGMDPSINALAAALTEERGANVCISFLTYHICPNTILITVKHANIVQYNDNPEMGSLFKMFKINTKRELVVPAWKSHFSGNARETDSVIYMTSCVTSNPRLTGDFL